MGKRNPTLKKCPVCREMHSDKNPCPDGTTPLVRELMKRIDTLEKEIKTLKREAIFGPSPINQGSLK